MVADGYTPGTPIVLASCYGAQNGTGAALSRLSGADVVAGTHTVVDHQDLKFYLEKENYEKFERATWMRYSNDTVKRGFFKNKIIPNKPSETDLNTIYIQF